MADAADHVVETRAGSCVVFLVDESEALEVRIAGGTKSKAESIATAMNSVLGQLSAAANTAAANAGAADLDVAIVGYRCDDQGGADVGCRWAGPLAGRRMVPVRELAQNPAAVENRTRRLPVPGNPAMLREETIRFPVWYTPVLGKSVYPVIGYGYCQHLLSSWIASAGTCRKPPLVVSFVGDWPSQRVEEAVVRVQGISSPMGPPLIFHVHLGGLSAARPVVCPSAENFLPADGTRDLFRWSAVLPDFMIAALRGARVPVNAGARGVICYATMTDLIRFLSLVKAYTEFGSETPAMPAGATTMPSVVPGLPSSADTPMPAPGPQAPLEPISLVVLLLDRSVSNPAEPAPCRTWTKREDQANELLGQVAKRGKDRVEAALISYGAGPDGRLDLRTTFEGPLGGRALANGDDLAKGFLRIAEVTERLPNGIGGLISFTRKKPIFLDLGPAGPSGAQPAFEAVARLVAEWRGRHPGSPCPPAVLHLTRGQCNLEELVPAMEGLRRAGAVLYHLVATESPHPSLSYPNSPEKILDPVLKTLWEWTSPLLGSQRLAVEKRTVAPDSRGMVVNGRFDLLLDGILATMESTV